MVRLTSVDSASMRHIKKMGRKLNDMKEPRAKKEPLLVSETAPQGTTKTVEENKKEKLVQVETKSEIKEALPASTSRAFFLNLVVFFAAYFLIRQLFYTSLPYFSDSYKNAAEESYSKNVWQVGDRLKLEVYMNEDDLVATHDFIYQEKTLWESFNLYAASNAAESSVKFTIEEEFLENSNPGLRVVLRNLNIPKRLQGLSRHDISSVDHQTYKFPLLTRQPRILEKKHPNFSPLGQYYYPKVHLNLVVNEGDLNVKQLAPFIRQKVPLVKAGPQEGQKTRYEFRHFPIMYMNDYWNLRENYKAIPTGNDADDFISFELYFDLVSMLRFKVASQFSFGLHQNESNYDLDSEDLRRLIGDTHILLLVLTLTVTTLHMIFDMLAFKNEISFWKNKTTTNSMAGLSLKSIILNVVTQSIILLYLMEEETSWVILISNTLGLTIEIWKMTRAFQITSQAKFPYISIGQQQTDTNSDPISTSVSNKSSSLSKEAVLSQEYDAMAMKYLSYILSPLLLAYIMYSYMTEPYLRLYNFVLKTLVSFIYAFGFVLMFPQLYLNYKLKSVAHMPWRSFIYKALNTFIDDLFAVVIKVNTVQSYLLLS